jgi:hypothetical protein
VDEPADFLRLQAELAGQAPCISAVVTSGPARHTRALLAEWADAPAGGP